MVMTARVLLGWVDPAELEDRRPKTNADETEEAEAEAGLMHDPEVAADQRTARTDPSANVSPPGRCSRSTG